MDRSFLKKLVPAYREFSAMAGKDDKYQPDDGNSVYAILHKNGVIKRESYHICFGNLESYLHFYGESNRSGIDALLIQYQTELIDESINPDLYYEWLFNYSPWREVFITKNLSTVKKNRVIVVNPDTDANLMIGGAIACRHPWENFSIWGEKIRNSVVLWQNLVEGGSDPTAAFAFANQVGTEENCHFKDGNWYVRTTGMGHQSISSHCSKYNIHANFILEKKNLYGRYSEELTYSHPSDVWKGDDTTSHRLDEFIINHLNDGEKKKVNPFTSTKKTETYSWDKITSVLKEIIPEYQSQIKEA